jgi:DNA-binding beta-propeller fold protein YncE
MTLRLSSSTKFMCAGIALSLGWFVLESCDCDKTKEDNFPGFWITCIGNKPTMMTYNGDNPLVITSDPSGSFDPKQWDCSTPGSPPQPKPGAPALKTGTPSGPGGFARKPHATPSGAAAYLPQQLRDLPFLPNVPPSANSVCDASFPDVFQTVHTQALVTRISTCPFSIKTTIPVVTRPLQVVMTPDGSTALVTSFDNAVNFIDLATNTVTYTLRTDPSFNPDGLAISPDGTRAYITSFNTNGGLDVIDLASRTIIATLATNAYPQGVAITPDGSQLWVTYPLGASVDIFDTLSNTHVTGLNVGETTDIAFNSTGTRAYITSQATTPGSVVVVDTSSYQILNTYTVGLGPTNISMSYADRFLVVNNNLEGSITVVDLTKSAVVTTKVGANSAPAGISWVH